MRKLPCVGHQTWVGVIVWIPTHTTHTHTRIPSRTTHASHTHSRIPTHHYTYLDTQHIPTHTSHTHTRIPSHTTHTTHTHTRIPSYTIHTYIHLSYPLTHECVGECVCVSV